MTQERTEIENLLIEWIELWADILRSQRPKIEMQLPPLNLSELHETDPEKIDDFVDFVDVWTARMLAKFFEERDAVIVKLAVEYDADPKELLKVADLLVDISPPSRRGRPKHHGLEILGNVALLVAEGKTQQTACDLLGISRDSFRKYRDQYPEWWNLFHQWATLEKSPDLRSKNGRGYQSRYHSLADFLKNSNTVNWPIDTVPRPPRLDE